MNIFEKMFRNPKKTEETAQEIIPEDVIQEESMVPEARKPKTMEDIKEAAGDIQDLRIKRWDKIQQHRDAVDELKVYGVNEHSHDSKPAAQEDGAVEKTAWTKPRTETAKDILNPIEDELAAISAEISNKREEFDLQPNREEVIDVRLHRLGELKAKTIKDFAQTISGKKIEYFDAQINNFHSQIDLYRKEIEDINEQKKKFFQTDQVAHDFAKRMERITNLEMELSDMLAKSRSTRYDKNGLVSRD